MAITCPKCHFENPDDTLYCGKCSTPLKPLEEISVTKTLETATEELTRGTTFAGRYEVIEELGKGGMGRVYRVEDKKIREEVALKLIKPEIATDERIIERFRNELKLARKITHKNVCRMHDFHEEEGTPFITMEYVEGEALKSLVKRKGKISEEEALSIAIQVCEGLAEAHGLGVVHRDLKPQNIMIDKEGHAKIMDFGIARSVEAKGVTETGVMIGTPDYISPEQAEGIEADERSDIYSLGVILYEMVTGKVPFEGDTALSVALKHKAQLSLDPKKINPDVSKDLSRLILICMEKDRKRRYQKAEELLSDLRNIEEGFPLGTKIRPRRETFIASIIRKKLFVPAFVITIAIIVVAVWQLLPQKEAVSWAPSGKPTLAVMYFENNTGDENLEYLRSGLAELLITDLNQSKFIYVLSGDRIYSILKKLNLLEEEKYSSEDLIEVVNLGGANYVLKGSYIKVGENFVITTTLQEPKTGEIISSKKEECKGEEGILAKVDELTKKIKLDLNISHEQIASDIDKEVGKITTSSPEAFKYYVEGVKYFNKGEHRKSIQFFEKAVAIDSKFAMAYRKMAGAYNNLGYDSKREEYRQKALESTDRVSDRERYIIQAQAEESKYKRIEILKKLLELYPDDRYGNSILGKLYGDIEEWDKAIDRYGVNIKNRIRSWVNYSNTAAYYAAKGMYDKAKEVLELYLNDISDNASIRWRLAWIYLCQSKFDLSLNEVDRGLSLSPKLHRLFWIKGSIYQCLGDFVQAEQEFRKLLEHEEQSAHLEGRDHLGALHISQGRYAEAKDQARKGIEIAESMGENEWKTNFHHFLAYMHFSSGYFNRALEKCDRALSIAREMDSLDWQIRNLHLKGLILVQKKLFQDAELVASESMDLIEKGMNRKLIRYYYDLMGRIELERGDFSKAIENFGEAISLLGYPRGIWRKHTQFFEPLALAYYRKGDLEKAEEQYKKIISLTAGRIAYGDIYAKSFYMLGKIYERKGWKGKAIEHYEKFLSLWKDADPGIAEVEDASRRLAELKDQQF